LRWIIGKVRLGNHQHKLIGFSSAFLITQRRILKHFSVRRLFLSSLPQNDSKTTHLDSL
jgi:hypothetical protein